MEFGKINFCYVAVVLIALSSTIYARSLLILRLYREQQRKFPPIAPDFVLELLSPTDSLEKTQAKMQEYMKSGMKLGWLVDRDNRYVEIYRINQPVEVLRGPEWLSGEEVLPGFVLNMDIVW